MQKNTYNFNLIWLFVGAFTGLIFAGYGIFTGTNKEQLVSANVAAIVNDAVISQETKLN